jgi:osmotically-inducible protein OsmY
MIDDASIDTAIKSKLAWSKYTSAVATGVDSQRGRVTLTGTTNSGAAKELAGRLALNTRGVISVDNQLIVDTSKPTMTEDAAHSASAVGQSIQDGWITTKVKSTFLYSSYVDSADIGVNTKGGVVTLQGKLASGTQRALAIELAKNVRGVKNVRAGGLTY